MLFIRVIMFTLFRQFTPFSLRCNDDNLFFRFFPDQIKHLSSAFFCINFWEGKIIKTAKYPHKILSCVLLSHYVLLLIFHFSLLIFILHVDLCALVFHENRYIQNKTNQKSKISNSLWPLDEIGTNFEFN